MTEKTLKAKFRISVGEDGKEVFSSQNTKHPIDRRPADCVTIRKKRPIEFHCDFQIWKIKKLIAKCIATNPFQVRDGLQLYKNKALYWFLKPLISINLHLHLLI